MWKDNRYVATRDPSRGGLYIAATTENFDEKHKREIYDNCVEMICKDIGTVCMGLYPMRDGKYSLAMGYKINGNKQESRPHEVIRGMVLEKDELLEICKAYIAENQAWNLFFSELNPDKPELWVMPRIESMINDPKQLDFFMNLRSYTDVWGLSKAIRIVENNNMKIQLLIPNKDKALVFSAISSFIIHENAKLFLMLDGECTLSLPSIIIADELIRLDEKMYCSMTWEQFLDMGNDNNIVEQPTYEKENKNDELLDLCEEYLEFEEVSDYDLYQCLDEIAIEEPIQFYRFKSRLRKMLFHYPISDISMERFMKLLYIAFKKRFNADEEYSVGLALAPYDFYGMNDFLKKKIKSNRQLKKYQQTMFEVQFSACKDSFLRKTVHNASVTILCNK